MTALDTHKGDLEAAEWRRQWALSPDAAYLNHGSVGASPLPVLDAWTNWIRRIDESRLGFYRHEARGALGAARARLAAFVGTSKDNVVFMTNATMAMLAVAKAFRLQKGDEVLITDHDYWSVFWIWDRVCRDAGAKLVVKQIGVPLKSREALVDDFLSAVTKRTRLLIFSHISYRTSIIMPAGELCRRARELGVPVLIDGAHAVAQLPLDLDGLDCDYYVASCHKWLCAPAGTGFLYVNPNSQAGIEPLCASREDDWQEIGFIGTEDYSRYLAIPSAIDFMESAPLSHFRTRTHALAQYARQRITELTGLEPWFPDSPEWYGSLVALPLPPVDEQALLNALWNDYAVESYVKTWNDLPLIRVSCHLYTPAADIDRLVSALEKLLPACAP